MAIRVNFQNPKTGELKEVKVGWSWTLLFFATFLGIPLFMRKLTTLAYVALAMNFLNVLAPLMIVGVDERTMASLTINFLATAMNVWLAIKGNEMTAKNLLDLGWSFVDPQSPEVGFAKKEWNLAALPIHQTPTSIG